MPEAFNPTTPTHARMVGNCRNSDIAYKFKELRRFSPTALRGEVGPTDRLFRGILRSPATMARATAKSDAIGDICQGNGIYIVVGGSKGNVSLDAIRTLLGGVQLRIMRLVKREPHPVIVNVDEANNYGLVGWYEATSMAECLKLGLEWRVITQHLNFPSPDVTEGVLTNCGRHEWFRQGSAESARIAAQDTAIPSLDPKRIHHIETRRRQIHAGYDKETSWNWGRRRDENGYTVGEDTRMGEAARPRYADIEESVEHYEALQNQILLQQKALMNLGVGWRFVRDEVGVRKEYVEQLEEHPCVFPGLAEKRVERLMEEMRQRPCYQIPVIPLLTERKPEKPKIGPIARLRAKRESKRSIGGNGMKRS